MTVIWKDPPTENAPVKRTYHRPWVTRLEPVMERPGKWALVDIFSHYQKAQRTAYRLTQRAVVLPPGRWEFLAVRTEDRGGELYARFLGIEEAS